MKFESLNKKSFSFKGGPVGCILLHGFTSNPEEMQKLGEYLAEKGVSIRIPLLPGHGTVPSDLAQIKWTDWTGLVRDEYFNLRKTCQEIFVCGQSMGGTLALHLGSHHPVNGIISIAAPVKYERKELRYIPLLKRFMKYYPKKHGNDIGDPELKERHQSYPVYPLPAILEFQTLIRHTFDDLPEITAPTLVVHSESDHTISHMTAEIILRRIQSAEKVKLMFQKSYHLITLDFDREQLYQRIFEFIKRHSQNL